MTRRPSATTQNRTVALELMREVARTDIADFAQAVRPLQHLDPAASPEAVLDAFATVRSHRAVLDRRLDHLLGLAVLEGVPVHEVARTTGISTRTLTRRLAGTPAAWVGHPLRPAPYSRWGWTAAG